MESIERLVSRLDIKLRSLHQEQSLITKIGKTSVQEQPFWLSRLFGDKHCLFKGLEQSENHLNKQANNFSFIRSKLLNP